MNRILPLLLIISLFIVIGFTATHFSKYQPYSQIDQTRVKTMVPKSYDDCIPKLDSILSPIAKQHFKLQDSTIAVIEICEEIGGFFTTNWRFYKFNKSYHWPDKDYTEIPTIPKSIVSRFVHDGIGHPKAMLRIMFTCYYKYLNGQEYSWEDEISKVKQLWPEIDPTNYKASLPDTVARIESKLLSTYYFNLLDESDTVNVLYNRPPRMTKKSSDWYYLTGIINLKFPESKSINIRIIKIESEFKENYYPTDTDTIFQGDTITDYHIDWLSRNKYYFDYHTCKERREAFNLN